MAKTCSVFDSKIGSFEKYNIWIQGRDDLPICLSCTEKFKQAKQTDINPENKVIMKMHLDAIEFLIECAHRDNIDDLVKAELKRQLPSYNEALAQYEDAKKKKEETNKKIQEAQKEFITTTTSSIEGYRILKCDGVLTSDAVIGTGIFADTAAALSDLTGSKSISLASKMREVKTEALMKLKKDTVLKGCNALIGVSYFPYVINGNMMGVSVAGTAVLIEKDPENTDKNS